MVGIDTHDVDHKQVIHLISALIAADEKKSGIEKKAKKAAADIKEATKTGSRIKQEAATQKALEELFKGNPLLDQEKISSIQDGLLSVLNKGGQLDIKTLLKDEIELLGADSKGGIACAKLLADDGTGQSRLDGFTQDMLAKQSLVNGQLKPALEACKTPQEYNKFLKKVEHHKGLESPHKNNNNPNISSNQFKNMLAAETLLLELIQKLDGLNATAQDNSMSYEGVMGDIIKNNAVDKANAEMKKINAQHHESTCQKVVHALEIIVGVALLIVAILTDQPELAVVAVILVLQGTGLMSKMVGALAKLVGSKLLAELIISVIVLVCTAGLGVAADVEMTAGMIARTVFMVLSSTGLLTDGLAALLELCGVPKDEAEEIATYIVLAITIVTIVASLANAVKAAGGIAKAASAVGNAVRKFFSGGWESLMAFFSESAETAGTALENPDVGIELQDLSRLRGGEPEGSGGEGGSGEELTPVQQQAVAQLEVARALRSVEVELQEVADVRAPEPTQGNAGVRDSGEPRPSEEGDGSGDVDAPGPGSGDFAAQEQAASIEERGLGEEVEGRRLEEGRESLKGKKSGKLSKLREMLKGSKKLKYIQGGLMGITLAGMAAEGVCNIEIGKIQLELASLIKEIAAMDAANVFAHMNLEMAQNSAEGYNNEDKTNQKTTVDSAKALQNDFSAYQQMVGMITA